MKLRQGDYVKIDWVDSMSHSGWHEFKDTGMNCRTVGILYDNHKNYVVVAQSESLQERDKAITLNMCADYLQIPRKAITKIVKLIEAK